MLKMPNIKISRKLFLILTGAVALLAVVGALIVAYYALQQQTYSNLPYVQQQVQTKVKANSYNINTKLADKNALSGTLTKQSFKGSLKYNKILITNIVSTPEGTFTQNVQTKSPWQKDDTTLKSLLTILEHPEYIQLQSRLDDLNNDLQYAVLFEKPDQDIIKNVSPEQLTQIRLTGTITIDPKIYQLKQMKLHQGNDTKNEITIDYTLNPNPPVIKVPKV